MFTNLRFILLSALRDYLFLGLVIVIAVAATISAVLGSTAMVEKQAMTLVFSAASTRVILILGLVIFVAFHIRQAFDQKEIDVLLSRPLSRWKIMLSYWLGFSFVAFLLVLAAAAILSFLPILNFDGYVLWITSLWIETLVMVAFALFSSFALSSAVSSVMVTMAFYVIGRMMAFFSLTSESRILFDELWLNNLLRMVIEAVSAIIPRIDLMTQSEWMVYGVQHWNEVQIAGLEALIAIPLLLCAATIDLMRKEF